MQVGSVKVHPGKIASAEIRGAKTQLENILVA
jgi:hypothetical protein